VHDKASEFAGRAVHEWTGQLFAAADGELLSAQYKLMIRTEREKARERGKYAAIQPYVYSDAEIENIERSVLAEQPRGAVPRYWEDVQPGDEAGMLVKGPLTVTDIVCWHVGVGMGLYNIRPLGLGVRNRKRIPRFYHRDELNVPDVMQRVHWDPEFARRSGNPTTFDYGRMREFWLIHACTDWMGDDAWLWKLSCEFRGFNYVGDTQWISGQVTRRYLADGGRPAVDLTLSARNQRDAETTTGTATILLPSRAFQTGLDVRQLAGDRDALREQSRRTKNAELRISAWHNRVGKPVIAAVNGVCAGGGLHFVADADIVIAAQRATFLDPHVSLGQASAFELIGLARRGAVEPVLRLGLSGRHERLDAARAYQLGIVSEVVSDDVRAAARQLAEKISRNPPETLRLVKHQLSSARCGARSRPASPRPAAAVPARSSAYGAIPTRTKVRARSPRSGSRGGPSRSGRSRRGQKQRAAGARLGPDGEAVVDGGLRVSWSGLAERMTRAARAYAVSGVRPGDRVALWAPNSLDWIVAALGVYAAGAVLVPVNTRLKGTEAAHALRTAGGTAAADRDRLHRRRLHRNAGQRPGPEGGARDRRAFRAAGGHDRMGDVPPAGRGRR
jgi:enoyl-CoA hydratase/carnithine racemase